MTSECAVPWVKWFGWVIYGTQDILWYYPGVVFTTKLWFWRIFRLLWDDLVFLLTFVFLPRITQVHTFKRVTHKKFSLWSPRGRAQRRHKRVAAEWQLASSLAMYIHTAVISWIVLMKRQWQPRSKLISMNFKRSKNRQFQAVRHTQGSDPT